MTTLSQIPRLGLGPLGVGRRVAAGNVLTLTLTTSSSRETVTINRLTPTGGNCVIDWGDGTTTTVAAGTTTAINKVYASAGVYSAVVSNANLITGIRLQNAKISNFDTAQLAGSVVTNFIVTSILTSIINTANMVDWRPSGWHCYSMPSGSLTITAAANFANWITATSVQMQSSGLLTADVDRVLEGFWGMFPARTATGGALNVGGTNQAPGGTFQAGNPPTTGKEYAYELLNDGQNVNPTKRWATVTITA